ncbi:hypothetical protein FI667_g7678, partial [Globisporangium splendens]
MRHRAATTITHICTTHSSIHPNIHMSRINVDDIRTWWHSRTAPFIVIKATTDMEPPARVGMQLLAEMAAQTNTQQLSSTNHTPAGRLRSVASKRALQDDEGGIATTHERAVMTTTTTASEASEEDLREQAAQAHAKKKVKRKASHVLRREAKEQLLTELRELEQRSRQLREQAGLPDNSDVLARKEENATMHKALQRQKLVIANAQSVFSQYMNSQMSSPISSFIRLGRDWRQRRKTMIALKEQKLHESRQFLHERTRFMNPLQGTSESSKFETPDGDFWVMQLDVTPFTSAYSVKSIFEALQFQFKHLEITTSEMSGFITVRENDNDDSSYSDPSVLNHRLMTSTPSGLVVEKNCLMFLDNSSIEKATCVADESAFIVMDFVDEDALYPYCPSQRIRRDVTAAIKLSTHRRKPRRDRGARVRVVDRAWEEEEDDLVIVFTRYFAIKTHHPEFYVPHEEMLSLCEDITCAVETMIRSMVHGAYPSVVGQ